MFRGFISRAVVMLTVVSLTACGGGSGVAPAPHIALTGPGSAGDALPQWDGKSLQATIRSQPAAAGDVSVKTQETSTPTPVARRAPSPDLYCNPDFQDCPPRPTPRPTTTPHIVYQQAVINVPVPDGGVRRPRAGRRSARYVSSGTNSAQLTVSNPAPGSPATYAADCTPNADSTKTCTINNIGVAGGTTQTFSVKVFTGAGQTGTLLGSGSATATIVLGAANQVNVAVSPVVYEIGFAFSTDVVANPAFNLVMPIGTARSFPLAVTAFDFTGNEVPTAAAGSQYLDSTGAPFSASAAIHLDPSSPAGTLALNSAIFYGPTSSTTTGSYSGATLGAGASVTMSVTTSDPNVYVDPPVPITNN